MIVIDASALVELLLGTPRSVPLTSEIAAGMIFDLAVVDIARYLHDPLLSRVWQLRGNLTPYDACYVALAEALAAPLVTYDARLAAAPGNRATVELFR